MFALYRVQHPWLAYYRKGAFKHPWLAYYRKGAFKHPWLAYYRKGALFYYLFVSFLTIIMAFACYDLNSGAFVSIFALAFGV